MSYVPTRTVFGKPAERLANITDLSLSVSYSETEPESSYNENVVNDRQHSPQIFE